MRPAAIKGSHPVEDSVRKRDRMPSLKPIERMSAIALACATALLGFASPEIAEGAAIERAPCLERNPLRNAYFGDLHVHTAYSQDASTQGTRALPDDAYRFARGETLGVQPYDANGKPLRSIRLRRPLDFVAVTDHAEQFGETHICRTPGLPGHDSWICRVYRRWPRLAFFLMNTSASAFGKPDRFDFCGKDGRHCLEAARIPWQDTQAAAEAAYDRTPQCEFTSFVAYEWTAAPSSNNLHRNVIFRNEIVPELPISYFEAHTAQALWKSLDDECLQKDNGCDVLVIPHNSNLSGGLMFLEKPLDGGPPSLQWAEDRAFFEPLVEVMQHKGGSECLVGIGNTDEACGFEKMGYSNFAGKFFPPIKDAPERASFVRHALGRGLVLKNSIGANPFKFGMVGGTDTHLGAAGAADEDRFLGHGGAGVPADKVIPPGLPDDIDFNPGGLTVAWAEENTRDSLFEAFRRKETYATSGPRMTVRVFGGWDIPGKLCGSLEFVRHGYLHGVPMGGDLPPRDDSTGDGPPRFAVWAQADPGTNGSPHAPIERLQMVKGWLDADGNTRERVYDIAGDRDDPHAVNPDTCELPPGGNASLCTVWTDPDFRAGEDAFYYVRVLEVPTCRWNQYICLEKGVDCDDESTIGEGLEPCCDADTPKTIQERAWTSPIWYVPVTKTELREQTPDS
jgi:hypothetical protein